MSVHMTLIAKKTKVSVRLKVQDRKMTDQIA